MPRDQKPRLGNEDNNDDDNDNDHDNYDAIVVLIASVLFLFFAFGNFNSFAQVFIYASYDKKMKTNKKGL